MFFDQEKKKDLRKTTTVKKKSKIQWKERKHTPDLELDKYFLQKKAYKKDLGMLH